ncbi:MAG: hypothetical protein K0S79_2556 [Nitrospira sp.]|nr:hypothetical protein [Nitrospira sp.]
MTRPITDTLLVTAVLMALLAAGTLTHPVATLAGDPEIKEGTLHLVSGTLLRLDLLNGRGLLRTDLGRPIYFEVPKAYLFENVIVGARISLRLDEEGRAVRVMDTAIADVVITPDQPLAATAPEEP